MLIPLKGSFFLRLFLQNEPIIVTPPYVAQVLSKCYNMWYFRRSTVDY